MENILAIIGFGILIGSCIRIFKFIRHKLWLYLPLFLLGGIAIGVGFIFIFGVDPGWAGEMSVGYAGVVAVLYEIHLEKKYKKQKKRVIKFIKLDKRYKIYIYRFGLINMVISGIGLILLAINSYFHWREDILKTKKNPEFNGLLEQFFYIIGWINSVFILLVIIALIFGLFEF